MAVLKYKNKNTGLREQILALKGKDNVAIVKSEINAIGELVVTYSDGTTDTIGSPKQTNIYVIKRQIRRFIF